MGATPIKYDDSGERIPEPPIEEPVYEPSTVGGNKPMVTRFEYEQARAVLDALPPGYYVKCAGCSGWWTKGNFVLAAGNGPFCERCAS